VEKGNLRGIHTSWTRWDDNINWGKNSDSC